MKSGEEQDGHYRAFYDKENIKKIVQFLCEPKTSKWSNYYNLLLSIIVTLHIVFLMLETADGPNHYTNRPNHSTLPFLLTDQVDFN